MYENDFSKLYVQNKFESTLGNGRDMQPTNVY